MKILEIFFIVVVLIACMFGMMFAMISAPNPASAVDSYNNTASLSTNQSAQLIQSVAGGAVNTTVNGTTTTEQIAQPGMTGMMGWFIVLMGVFALILVFLFIINAYKKMPGQGYRRG